MLPSGLSRTVVVATSLALAACGGAGGGDQGDEAGLAGPDRWIAWEKQPVYTIGGAEAEGWSAFGAVEGVAFDAAGNLYVLDRQASTVLVVAPDGSLLRRVGSPGQGPGELGQTMGMTVLPDGTVAVFDISKFGIVVYGPDGEWIRNVRVDPQDVGLLTPPFVPLPAGSFAAQIGGRIRTSAGVETEPGRPVVRIPLDADEADPPTILTGWEPPEPESDGQTTSFSTDGGGSVRLQMQRLRGFTPELHMASLLDGRILMVDSTTYRIGVYAADGTFQFHLSRPIEPVAVDPSIEDRERDRRLEELEASGRGELRVVTIGGSGGGAMAAPDMSEMMRKRIEEMIFYPEIQVIEGIAADWSGRIWVQRASGEPGEPGPTDILTADQEYLGTLPPDGIRIPDAFGPDGLAVWIERDEYDVQRLVVAKVVAAG